MSHGRDKRPSYAVAMSNAVRRATLDDCAEVGRVHYRAHIESYVDHVPAGVIESFPAEQRAENWKRMVSAGVDELWVAEEDGQIVGFASAGPSRDTPPVRARELSSIYLLAAHQGSSLGQTLLDAACGTQPASLWVLEDNPRAHAFYRRNGFLPDGTSKLDKPFGNVRIIRMVR